MAKLSRFVSVAYTFDLTASDHGKGDVKVNQNAVFDQAGNGNNMIRNSFVYCSRNVPTLTLQRHLKSKLQQNQQVSSKCYFP